MSAHEELTEVDEIINREILFIIYWWIEWK